MIKELMHDPIFLAGKSEVATKEDLPIAQDLLDTLIAHKDGCVGMAANMIGQFKRIIAFLDESGRAPTSTVILMTATLVSIECPPKNKMHRTQQWVRRRDTGRRVSPRRNMHLPHLSGRRHARASYCRTPLLYRKRGILSIGKRKGTTACGSPLRVYSSDGSGDVSESPADAGGQDPKRHPRANARLWWRDR